MEVLNHFVIVQTNTCTKDDVKYVINTSIKAFIYKVEIFKNEVLVDVIEVNCTEKYNQKIDNHFFVNKYQEAHKSIRDNYCYVEEARSNDHSIIFEKKENSFFESMKHANILKKAVLWALVLGIVSYLLIVKMFVYSDIYIDNFLEEENKITYLEQVELRIHRLEKECTLLSKKQLNPKSLVSLESCKKWCDKGIIAKEKCDLFLAYFFIKMDTQITNVDTDEIRTSYSVLPQEDTIEFNVFEVSQLRIYNKSNHQIFVTLKDIHLDNSNNEEIVQFKQAKISFVLKEEEGKSFHMFLEPSYYKQFEVGKYTGLLLFDVKYKNKIIGSIKKQFYFMVR